MFVFLREHVNNIFDAIYKLISSFISFVLQFARSLFWTEFQTLVYLPGIKWWDKKETNSQMNFTGATTLDLMKRQSWWETGNAQVHGAKAQEFWNSNKRNIITKNVNFFTERTFTSNAARVVYS